MKIQFFYTFCSMIYKNLIFSINFVLLRLVKNLLQGIVISIWGKSFNTNENCFSGGKANAWN